MTDTPSGPRPLPDLIAGRYRVVSQLGAGGMGLVYKAIDTRLDRAVAIKAIHDRRLLQQDAARRLRAEALAAASLDHPYICKVYELLEEADETLLVMELVEGQTLSAILRRGTPPLAQTLQLGREIAEGLAAAHARGLVHRDIKPSNVIVTPHGHVKLLDFGLARTDTTTHASEATRTSPQATSAYAGTPFYMAPEQATGQPITSRADLFSLGVVLFECLTGKLPFAGTSGYDYVRHLLSDDPRPLYRLAPQAPADLVRLVERCIEKSPAARIDSAVTVVAELQQLADSLTRSSTDVRTAGEVRKRRRGMVVAAACCAALAALVVWMFVSRPPDPTSVVVSSRPFASGPAEDSDSRISPDGQWISFLSTRGAVTQLFVQRVDGAEPRAVTLAAGRPVSHLWSPDGRELACLLSQGNRLVLYIVPAFFGGAARQQIPIEAPNTVIRLLRWIDRTIYFQISERTTQLSRADLGTGVVMPVSASWKVDGSLAGFDVHPDGTQVTYVVGKNGQDDLWVGNLDGTGARRLTTDAAFERTPLWRGRGATILFRSNRAGQIDLWEIDPRTSRAWALTSSQTDEQPESSSLDGRTITFQQSSEDAKLWLIDAATGRSRQMTAGTLSDAAPTWSADGTRVVFQRTQPSPSQSVPMVDARLYAVELRDGSSVQEPRAITEGFAAVLAPDGASVVYQQRHTHPTEMALRILHLATGSTVTLTEHSMLSVFSPFPLEWVEQIYAWSPTGNEVYFVDYGDRPTVRRFRIGDDGKSTVLATAAADEYVRDLYPSPDGRWLTFITWKSGAAKFHIVELATGRVQERASFPTGAIHGCGWLPNDRGFLLLRRGAPTPGAEIGVSAADLLIVPQSGPLEPAGTIDSAYLGTAKFDPSRLTLYFTQSLDGIHNLNAYSLTSRTVRQLTENAVPGVTFSGVRVGASGALLVVRDARVRDIWMAEIGPGGSSRR